MFQATGQERYGYNLPSRLTESAVTSLDEGTCIPSQVHPRLVLGSPTISTSTHPGLPLLLSWPPFSGLHRAPTFRVSQEGPAHASVHSRSSASLSEA